MALATASILFLCPFWSSQVLSVCSSTTGAALKVVNSSSLKTVHRLVDTTLVFLQILILSSVYVFPKKNWLSMSLISFRYLHRMYESHHTIVLACTANISAVYASALHSVIISSAKHSVCQMFNC